MAMITTRDARVAKIMALRQRLDAQGHQRTYRTAVSMIAALPVGPMITAITPTGDRPLPFAFVSNGWQIRRGNRING